MLLCLNVFQNYDSRYKMCLHVKYTPVNMQHTSVPADRYCVLAWGTVANGA